MAANPKTLVPFGLSLRPFQKIGVKFLTDAHETGLYHKLLADDMGLGKTVQAIVALNRINAKSAVVVCPAGVKIQWAREIGIWSNRPRSVFVVQGRKSNIPPGVDIIIVNYEMMLQYRINRQITARGEQQPYDAVILDEAHYLKSTNAKRTDKVFGKNSFLRFAVYKWALTGTPVLNRPIELYPMLYTLAPRLIEPHVSYNAYAKYFCNAHQKRKCKKCGCMVQKDDKQCPRCTSKSLQGFDLDVNGGSNLKELSDRIKPFMLRRKFEDVETELPPVVETIVEMDEVIPPVDVNDAPIATVRRQLGLAKVPSAIIRLKELAATVNKVVVFGHHRDVLEQLAAGLTEHNPLIIYGGMDAEEKQAVVDRFMNDPTVGFVLCNTAAGGLGIDGFQKVAHHVIFAEFDWSPGVIDQARKRLQRIGQTMTVFVQYWIVPNSLETVMMDVVTHKRYVIGQVIKADEVDNDMSLDSLLERAVVALEKIAGGEGADLGPAKPEPKKTATKKPEAPANTGATAAQAKNKATAVTFADMQKACGEFIAGGSDKAANRKIINTQIWPKYGATELANLPEESFADALADLKKGPDAYTLETETEDDGLGV